MYFIVYLNIVRINRNYPVTSYICLFEVSKPKSKSKLFIYLFLNKLDLCCIFILLSVSASYAYLGEKSILKPVMNAIVSSQKEGEMFIYNFNKSPKISHKKSFIILIQKLVFIKILPYLRTKKL